MEVWKTMFSEFNGKTFYKIDNTNVKFRQHKEADIIGTHMNWKRKCILPDKVRQKHTLVVKPDWFGERHAANLYNNSEKMNKEDNDSTVLTDTENKVDKYLVKVFRKLGEFSGNWVSFMDYKKVQPKNKIIFC